MKALLASPVLALLTLMPLAGCSGQAENEVQGYMEGDFVRISLPESGVVTSLMVSRGDVVEKGVLLYTLDDDRRQAVLDRARAELVVAESELKNLMASERTEEIRALSDEVTRLEANLDYTQREYKRQASLSVLGAAARKEVERLRSEKLALEAQVRAARSRLSLAQLSIGRKEEIATATKTLQVRQASVQEAEAELELRRAYAPQKATVTDVICRPGETVTAGQAVVELLPPENIKARFYLSPAQIGRTGKGTAVSLRCEGRDGDIPARISYIAPEASYRPPVLYARNQTEKLCFLVEAVPDDKTLPLYPGQPVTVVLPR